MTQDADKRFPMDEMSLRMLMAACEINEDTGRTHLMDFLDMGTVIKSEGLMDGPDPLGGDKPTYLVEYEPGKAPRSPNGVIRDLAEEILRLRGELSDSERGEAE